MAHANVTLDLVEMTKLEVDAYTRYGVERIVITEVNRNDGKAFHLYYIERNAKTSVIPGEYASIDVAVGIAVILADGIERAQEMSLNPYGRVKILFRADPMSPDGTFADWHAVERPTTIGAICSVNTAVVTRRMRLERGTECV